MPSASGHAEKTTSETLTSARGQQRSGPPLGEMSGRAGPSSSTAKEPLPPQSLQSDKLERRAGLSGWAAAPPFASSGDLTDMTAASAMKPFLEAAAEARSGTSQTAIAQADALSRSARPPMRPGPRPSELDRSVEQTSSAAGPSIGGAFEEVNFWIETGTRQQFAGQQASAKSTRDPPGPSKTQDRPSNRSNVQKREDKVIAKQSHASTESPPVRQAGASSQQSEDESRLPLSERTRQPQASSHFDEGKVKQPLPEPSRRHETSNREGEPKAKQVTSPSPPDPKAKSGAIEPQAKETSTPVSRLSKAPGQQGEAKAKEPSGSSTSLKGKNRHVSSEAKKSSASSFGPTQSQTAQRKTEANQPSTSFVPKPQGRAISPPASRQTVTQSQPGDQRPQEKTRSGVDPSRPEAQAQRGEAQGSASGHLSESTRQQEDVEGEWVTPGRKGRQRARRQELPPQARQSSQTSQSAVIPPGRVDTAAQRPERPARQPTQAPPSRPTGQGQEALVQQQQQVGARQLPERPVRGAANDPIERQSAQRQGPQALQQQQEGHAQRPRQPPTAWTQPQPPAQRPQQHTAGSPQDEESGEWQQVTGRARQRKPRR